jgi:hypothetical protein
MAKQETVPFFWKYGGMLQSLSLRLPNLIPCCVLCRKAYSNCPAVLIIPCVQIPDLMQTMACVAVHLTRIPHYKRHDDSRSMPLFDTMALENHPMACFNCNVEGIVNGHFAPSLWTWSFLVKEKLGTHPTPFLFPKVK